MQPSILLATNGTPGALGAVRIALELGSLHGARVEVIAVHEPIPMLIGVNDPFAASYIASELEQYQALRARVEAQLAEVGGPAPGWPLMVKSGPVGPLIARAATDCAATLVVVGLRHYSRHEHWIGRETPLRVMHLAHVPVLAVPPTAVGLPRKVLIATDLGGVSLTAAHDALQVAGPGATLQLVTVLPTESVAEDGYRTRVANRLAEVALELSHGRPGSVQTEILSGDPADGILRLAAQTGAELIAAGSHSYSLFERVLLGSTASRLVRGAECSVLVTPPLQIRWDLRRDLTESELLAHLGRAVGQQLRLGEIAPAQPVPVPLTVTTR
jgi:nucleotide-binding universal stress UspA family protein